MRPTLALGAFVHGATPVPVRAWAVLAGWMATTGAAVAAWLWLLGTSPDERKNQP